MPVRNNPKTRRVSANPSPARVWPKTAASATSPNNNKNRKLPIRRCARSCDSACRDQSDNRDWYSALTLGSSATDIHQSYEEVLVLYIHTLFPVSSVPIEDVQGVSAFPSPIAALSTPLSSSVPDANAMAFSTSPRRKVVNPVLVCGMIASLEPRDLLGWVSERPAPEHCLGAAKRRPALFA